METVGSMMDEQDTSEIEGQHTRNTNSNWRTGQNRDRITEHKKTNTDWWTGVLQKEVYRTRNTNHDIKTTPPRCKVILINKPVTFIASLSCIQVVSTYKSIANSCCTINVVRLYRRYGLSKNNDPATLLCTRFSDLMI